MGRLKSAAERGETTLPDPPIAHLLFSTTRFAWLFTVIRVYLGWQWVAAGWQKVTDPAWISGGEALRAAWAMAVPVPAPPARPAIAFDWYRGLVEFLLTTESHRWFAPLVAYGELLLGIALIVGAFVGITAFFGALMNWNFIIIGAASTNVVLFTLAILLMLAWKVAGYYGLDYYLLPLLGTPWGRNARPARAAIGGTAR